MKCNKCGTQLNPNEMSCPWCGEPVPYQTPIDPLPGPKPNPKPAPAPNPQPQPKPAPTPKISPKLIGGIVCVVVALLIVIKLIPISANNVVHVTPIPYNEVTPRPTPNFTPSPEPVHVHYYWGATCEECGQLVSSFDDVEYGEFYARLKTWDKTTMTVELMHTSDSRLADSRVLTGTGIEHTFDITNIPVGLDYRWCDGGLVENADVSTLDEALAYTPQAPYHEKYAGKSIKKSLGDEINICFFVEYGEVTGIVIMYESY